jgi:hypothetical protein
MHLKMDQLVSRGLRQNRLLEHHHHLFGPLVQGLGKLLLEGCRLLLLPQEGDRRTFSSCERSCALVFWVFLPLFLFCERLWNLA